MPVLGLQELAREPLCVFEFLIAKSSANGGGIGRFFPAAQLFAANAISGLILAIYMVSPDSKTSSYDHIMAFESKQRISNAVEPACGAIKFVLPSAAMQLERKIAKASAAYVLFLHVHCVLTYFCMLRR